MATGLFVSRAGKGGPRPGYVPKNRHLPPDCMGRLADALADGFSIRAAAISIGIGERTATRLFAEMRARLGWQAV